MNTTNTDLINAMKQNGNLIIAHVGNPEPKKLSDSEIYEESQRLARITDVIKRPVLNSRRFALVIGNELHLRKYEDPAHGWLAVPMQWIEALGIVGSISDFSYLRGKTAYLEEDDDQPAFHRAAKEAGFTIFYDVTHTNAVHPIRSYPRFASVIAEQTTLAGEVIAELITEGR